MTTGHTLSFDGFGFMLREPIALPVNSSPPSTFALRMAAKDFKEPVSLPQQSMHANLNTSQVFCFVFGGCASHFLSNSLEVRARREYFGEPSIFDSDRLTRGLFVFVESAFGLGAS
jgi:hypothetical protein